MIRKLNGFFLLILFSLTVSTNAFASEIGGYYPPSDSDYYQKKISTKLYFDSDTYKVRITQFKYGLPQDDPANIVTQKTWNVKPNSEMWVDMTCKGTTSFEYLDLNGTVLDFHSRGQTDSYLNLGTCNSNSIAPSDYNEDENKYKSDTFGATKPVSTTPTTADGSGGGTRTSPYYGDGSEPHPDDPSTTDPGTGGDTGGTDPGGECIGCDLFSCPGWSDYMEKLDQIKNSIPPAPNWDDVAGKFRDSIVPKLVNDLENMLGPAPTPPTPPVEPTGLDDRGISTKAPQMNDVPGLKESGISSDKIKNESPEIQFREDPTGGFDLIQNPLDSIPSLPSDSFPKPGETDPGEWGQNKPQEQDNPFPFPQETGEPDTGDTTTPIPGTDSGTPPVPGTDSGTVPQPSEDPFPGMKDYKPSPDSPDGSGGDL